MSEQQSAGSASWHTGCSPDAARYPVAFDLISDDEARQPLAAIADLRCARCRVPLVVDHPHVCPDRTLPGYDVLIFGPEAVSPSRCTWSEFAEANDPDTLAEVTAVPPGEDVPIGGGAAPLFFIRRIPAGAPYDCPVCVECGGDGPGPEGLCDLCSRPWPIA